MTINKLRSEYEILKNRLYDSSKKEGIIDATSVIKEIIDLRENMISLSLYAPSRYSLSFLYQDLESSLLASLILSCKNGHIKLTLDLMNNLCTLGHGFLIAIHRDDDGNSFLHIASEKGYTEIISFLLEKIDTYFQIKIEELNYAGQSSLYLASKGGYSEVVKLLLSISNNKLEYLHNSFNRGNIEFMKSIVTLYQLSNKYKILENELYDASKKGIIIDTASLIENIIDTHNNIMATIFYELEDHSSSYSLTDLRKTFKNTLKFACEGGQTEIITFLLDKFYDRAEAEDLTINSLLRIACQNGKTEIVEFLLDKFYDGEEDLFIDSLLPIASQNGYTELAIYLIEVCRKYGGDEAQITALNVAFRSGNIEFIKSLVVEGGFNINSQDDEGDTALNIAAHQADFENVKDLLSVKANPNIFSKNGQNALLYLKDHSNCHTQAKHILNDIESARIAEQKYLINELSKEEYSFVNSENYNPNFEKRYDSMRKEVSDMVGHMVDPLELIEYIPLDVTNLISTFLNRDVDRIFSYLPYSIDKDLNTIITTAIRPILLPLPLSTRPLPFDPMDFDPMDFDPIDRIDNHDNYNHLYEQKSLLIGSNFIVDGLKVIYEPTIEQFKAVSRDVVYIQGMLQKTSIGSLSIMAADVGLQFYHGEYMQGMAHMGTVIGFAVLPSILGPLGPSYTMLMNEYVKYQVLDNIDNFITDYNSPEFNFKSKIAYGEFYNYWGSENKAKECFVDAMNVADTDLEVSDYQSQIKVDHLVEILEGFGIDWDLSS